MVTGSFSSLDDPVKVLSHKPIKQLKVAIIGSGPGGLGAAIELAKLPFVDWKIYEKKPAISILGGGLTLQPQTWHLLERNGVNEHITTTDFFRAPLGQIEQRRNGRTGQILIERLNPKDVPPHRYSGRIARTKLQMRLAEKLDHERVYLSKKLVGMAHLGDNRLRISFHDGTLDDIDLLVAADGIRSVVRRLIFPDHVLQYNGQSVYRTTVSKTEVLNIDGIPWAPGFWKHTNGLYVYTCPLGDDDFEVTARIRRPYDGLGPTVRPANSAARICRLL